MGFNIYRLSDPQLGFWRFGPVEKVAAHIGEDSGTSQSSTATLNLFVNGQFLGTLQNQGGGKYGGTFNINTSVWSNPISIS